MAVVQAFFSGQPTFRHFGKPSATIKLVFFASVSCK